MPTDITYIGQRRCKLHTSHANPAFFLIQPTARHEEKNDGIWREMETIEADSRHGFVMAAFECQEWAHDLMPWHDEAVARDEEVGLHAHDTLHYVGNVLLPWMRERYDQLPCIIGGYSLGGLFALWAARETKLFSAVAAASPSLWIKHWTEYAAANALNAQAAYLSLGDREEHCRNQRMCRIGDCVRTEHRLLGELLGEEHTTLEWNPGGHFGQEAERTARAFSWCINNH